MRSKQIESYPLWGTHKTVFGSFWDKIAVNRQLLRLKDYYYWKRLGQENRQLHKEMYPKVKIESNYSSLSHWSDACAASCLATVLRPIVMKKQTQKWTEKSFLKKVYSKTPKFILKCNSRYTCKIVDRSTQVKSGERGKIFKTTSVTNLSAFSNTFLKSKLNDIFLMAYIKSPFQNVISFTLILEIMYLIDPLKTSLTRLCFRTGQTLRREENKAMKSFEGGFRNLNFSPSTSILLNFFFPFIDIRCFLFCQV